MKAQINSLAKLAQQKQKNQRDFAFVYDNRIHPLIIIYVVIYKSKDGGILALITSLISVSKISNLTCRLRSVWSLNIYWRNWLLHFFRRSCRLPIVSMIRTGF